ncbi:hypothetical protein HDU83_009259 [Entophlyctis luteolus]|nr:hypothetical protein HDU83_009259 [Entophlyctis luteolus]
MPNTLVSAVLAVLAARARAQLSTVTATLTVDPTVSVVVVTIPAATTLPLAVVTSAPPVTTTSAVVTTVPVATTTSQILSTQAVTSTAVARITAAAPITTTAASTAVVVTSQAATAGTTLFSENFENLNGQLTSNNWQITTGTGAQASLVTSGGNSFMRLSVPSGANAFLVPNSFAPPDNSFFGRLSVTVNGYPTTPDFAHWIHVQFTGTGNPTMVRPVGGQFIPASATGGAPAGNYWGVGADGGATGDWTNWKTTAPAANAVATCVEFQVNAADNSIQVWLNGVLKPELSVNQTYHGGNAVDFILPTANTIQIGWWLFQSNGNTYQVDIDNIELATQRIGC